MVREGMSQDCGKNPKSCYLAMIRVNSHEHTIPILSEPDTITIFIE